MALAITSSSYAGTHAGAYINAALQSADSLEYMTIRDAVNYKEVINVATGASMIVDATCNYTDGGTLTLTERVLEVDEFQINQDICRSTMINDWSYHQEDDFVAFAMGYVSNYIADQTESNIWNGTGGTGQILGLVTATTGAFATASVSTTGASTFTAANIIAQIQTAVADLNSKVYMADDLYLYMNKAAYRFYIQAISALSAFPFNHMGQYTPEFEGIKIAVVAGAPANTVTLAKKSNMFFGTSTALTGDNNPSSVRALDMSDIDGSEAVRLVARWSAGVQVGVGADITYHS